MAILAPGRDTTDVLEVAPPDPPTPPARDIHRHNLTARFMRYSIHALRLYDILVLMLSHV